MSEPPNPDLIAACFDRIAETGWSRFSVADAARVAGLPLDAARRQLPCRSAFLLAFGRLADAAAVEGASSEGTTRDRLFDVLMRRIDVLQAHRAGVLALLKGVMLDPAAGLLLAAATHTSMGWLLAAAGVDATGPLGHLRRKGLLAVWLWTIRAWQRDDGEDLAATMAALDQALAQADKIAGWISGAPRGEAPPADPLPEPAP
jgi:hypothetical protein